MAKRKKSKKKPQSEQVVGVVETPETTDAAVAAEAPPSPDPEVESAPIDAGEQENNAPAEQPAEPSETWPEDASAEADQPPVAEPNEFAEVWQGEESTTSVEVSSDDEAAASSPSTAEDATVSENGGDVPVEDGTEGDAGAPEADLLPSIIESLLFASDKALSLNDLKRLLGERDGKKVNAAVQALIERRKGCGIEVTTLSSGWHLRTNPDFAVWVSKLLVGRPVRLSRAMLETLAIVAYRQPVTRPEVDDIRGVDCGPVLKTLLDRGLIRIIGKKEEVGRPMLYGTTPEFLRVFNLRDLTELPTLREFYDLSAEDQSRVESEHGPAPEEQSPSATTPKPDVALGRVERGALTPEEEDTDPLLDELDEASQMAKQVLGDLDPRKDDKEEAPPTEGDAASAGKSESSDDTASSPVAGE
jgi:segregation and condensation protein B